MNSITPSELIGLLRTELGFSENALKQEESTLRDKYPIKFDLVIEDGVKEMETALSQSS